MSDVYGDDDDLVADVGPMMAAAGYSSPARSGGMGADDDIDAYPQQEQQQQYGAAEAAAADDNGAAADDDMDEYNGAAAAAAASDSNNDTATNKGGASSSSSSLGLIRLSLRKPMGIVFEPMTDPHNASQQRGVRICDLPRTGAAALSGRLQVGDELLSINDTTVSRLTFDEIMDFIIEADPESVGLLFRRPKKESLQAAMGIGGMGTGTGTGTDGGMLGGAGGNNDTKVKWIDDDQQKLADAHDDDSNVNKTNKKSSHRGDREGARSPHAGNKSSSGRRNRDRENRRRHDDDNTIGSGASYETRETLETMETRERRKGGNKGGGRSSSRRDRGGGGGSGRSRRKDFGNFGESFLDTLIDSLCAPLVGGGDSKKGSSKHSSSHHRGGLHRADTGDSSFYSDDSYDDQTYDDRTYDSRSQYDDDNTFATYESGSVTEVTKESARRRSKHQSGNKAHGMGGVGRSSSSDRDGDRDRDRDAYRGGRGTSQPTIDEQDEVSDPNAPPAYPESKPIRKSPGKPYEDDATLETVDTVERAANLAAAAAASAGGGAAGTTPLGLAPIDESGGTRGNNFGMPVGVGVGVGGVGGQQFGDPDLGVGAPPGGAAAAPNLPMSELEYDENFDHGADVSVMESLGGPSLLLENQRNLQQQQNSAAQQMAVPAPTKTVSPDLLTAYGPQYPGGEEAIVSDPDRFYRHVVQGLLERNEPEKVRLLDKLLAKYDGREEHLVTKLSVRYEQDAAKADADAAAAAAEAPAQFETFGGTNTFTGVTTPASAGGAGAGTGAGGDVWEDPPLTSPSNKAGGADHDHLSDVSGSKDHDDSYSSGSQYSGSSIDGTSPAVIAQVSELLNYVYGKTSVPGQIDRVSTIMRAYEGREGVLLELLETKALIKANAEGDTAMTDLPASLRDSPALAANQRSNAADDDSPSFDKKSSSPSGSPVSGLTATSPNNAGDGAAMRPTTPLELDGSLPAPENEDMGISGDAKADDESASFKDFSPVPPRSQPAKKESRPSPSPVTVGKAPATKAKAKPPATPSSSKKSAAAAAAARPASAPEDTPTKKKKKGIFKKVFGKSSKKDKSGSGAPSSSSKKGGGKGMLSPKGKNAGLLRVDSHEGSI